MFTQSFKLAKKIINNVEIGIFRKVHFKRSFFAVIIEIRDRGLRIGDGILFAIESKFKSVVSKK